MPSEVEVAILGPVEARAGGHALALPRGRARALLAMLALEPGRVVAVGRLIDGLWGSAAPRTATTALHGLVSTLRRRLGAAAIDGVASVLVTRAPGYLLDLPAENVDAERFRRLVQRARTNEDARARGAGLDGALGLWRGPALTDVADAPFAQAPAAGLEELRLVTLEDRIEADLALGRHEQLLDELETLVLRYPFRERLCFQLMLARYRAGRQSDALEAFREARERLVQEVGAEPGPELRGLHRAILLQEPALDPVWAGTPDPDAAASVAELTTRAGELLATAAEKVYARRYDAGEASDLFARAEALLPSDHPRLAEVVDRIPGTHLMLGRHREADARLAEALVQARARGETYRETMILLERARIAMILGPDPRPLSEIEAVARAALATATAAGDDVGVSRATFVLGHVAHRRGAMAEMERLARRGLEAAERSHHPRERLAARWWLALALTDGPTPDDRALAECLELADLGDGEVHAGVLTEVARLHARRGEATAARGAIDRARAWLAERPTMRRPAMFVEQRAGEVELELRRPAAAEPLLRQALAVAEELDERDVAAGIAVTLSLALTDLGRSDEARALAEHARDHAPSESVDLHARCRAALQAIGVRGAPGPGSPGRTA